MLIVPTRHNSLNLIGYQLTSDNHPGIALLPLRQFADQLLSDESKAKLAKKLVESLTAGQVIIINPSSNRTLQLLTISKKNGWVALEVKDNKLDSLEINLVFFPKPEHADKYYLAGRESRFGGPADRYPGSVGILKIELNLQDQIAYLIELQSAVKHQDPTATQHLITDHSTNLKSYYYHWARDLMKIGLAYLERAGINIVLGRSAVCPSKSVIDRPINREIILASHPRIAYHQNVITEDPVDGPVIWNQFKFITSD